MTVSAGFHSAPTATSALPSPSMSCAAMQTLSFSVKFSASTYFFHAAGSAAFHQWAGVRWNVSRAGSTSIRPRRR